MNKKIINLVVSLIALTMVIPSVSAIALTDDTYIDTTTTIDAGDYGLINDTADDGIIIINGTGITLTMSNVKFSGDGTGIGINITYGANDVTIIANNATINNYSYGMWVYHYTGILNVTGAENNELVINNTQGYGIRGYNMGGTEYFSYVNLTNGQNNAFYAASGDNSIYFDNCNVVNNTDGFHLSYASSNTQITNCYFSENGGLVNRYSVELNGDAGNRGSNIKIYNNEFSSLASTSDEIYINYATNVNITSNNLTTGNNGITVDNSEDVTIQSNTITDANGHSIYLNNSEANIISNTITNTGSGGIRYIVANSTDTLKVTNNIISGTITTSDIFINGTINSINVSNNQISDSTLPAGTPAISVDSSAGDRTDCYFNDNTINTSSIGIIFYDAYNASEFKRNNIQGGNEGYRLLGDTGTINIEDGEISNDVVTPVNISGSANFYLTNTTHNHSAINIVTGELLTGWYVRVKAVDGAGNALGGANSTIYNGLGDVVQNQLTYDGTEPDTEKGYTSYVLTYEDLLNATGVKTEYNNHTATVTLSGYNSGSTTQEIDSRDETIIVTLTTVVSGGGGGGDVTEDIKEETEEPKIQPLDLTSEGKFDWSNLKYYLILVAVIIFIAVIIKRRRNEY